MVLFPSPFYFVFASYSTYKIISFARPVMGTIFLVIIIKNLSQETTEATEATVFGGRHKLTSAMKQRPEM